MFTLAVCGISPKRIVLMIPFEGEKMCVVNTDLSSEMALMPCQTTGGEQPVVFVQDVNGRFVRRGEISRMVKYSSVFEVRLPSLNCERCDGLRDRCILLWDQKPYRPSILRHRDLTCLAAPEEQ
jgi:hypothetical protein